MKLSYSVSGPDPNQPKCRGTIVFMHGWPDNGDRLWTAQVKHLAAQNYRCVVISNLNSLGPQGGSQHWQSWGVGFETVVDLMHEIISNPAVCGRRQVDLFIHDWGAMYGYIYQAKYPQHVRSIFALDVGPALKPSLKELMFILAYQLPLILAFVLYNCVPIVGAPLGNTLTNVVIRTVGQPRQLRGPHQSAAMNFSYFHYYKERLFSALGAGKGAQGPTGLARLHRYRPQCHVFFGYGSKTPMRFHAPSWAKWLQTTPGCQFKRYETAHWIMVSGAKEVNADAEAFFNAQPEPQPLD